MQLKTKIVIGVVGVTALFVLTPTSPRSAWSPPHYTADFVVLDARSPSDDHKSGLHEALDRLLFIRINGRLRWLGFL